MPMAVSLKNEEVILVTQTCIADVKSMSFATIPWHSKTSLATKYQFSENKNVL